MKMKNKLLKNRKCGGRRLLAAALSMVTVFTLAACGKNQETGTGTGTDTGEVKEFVYVPEYIESDDLQEMNSDGGTVLIGDLIYYGNYSFDEEKGTSAYQLKTYALSDGTVQEIPLQLSEEQSMGKYTVDSEQNIIAVVSEYDQQAAMDNENYIPKTSLMKFDAQGNVLFSAEITDLMKGEEGQYSYIGNILTDKDNNIYLRMDSKIVLLNKEAEKQGEVSADGWISDMVRGSDDKVYIVYYDNGGAGGGMVCAAIDFYARKPETPLQNFPSGNGNAGIAVGPDNCFYVSDGSRVYQYDVSSQTSEELFSWLDCDINGTYVDYFGVMQDGRILVMIRDWNNDTREMAKLTRTKASEVAQKEQLVIGTLYESQQLQQAAVDFNKSNDKYRVAIKTYIDNNNWSESGYKDAVTNLTNDILSKKNGPDIMDLSQINEMQMVSKGVFEDLSPYLEKSSVISKEDFIDSILDSYTYDGKLYSIPSSFQLTTVAGKTSVVGEKMGWSLTEMMACAKEHPGAQLLQGMDQLAILNYCMIFNQDAFIDWEKQECHFDSDEFKQILEFIKMFPEEIDWMTYDGSNSMEKLEKEEVLLETVGIYDFQEVQVYPAMFGGADITYIGYPTTDGSVGCVLNTSSRYGISTQSGHKDGAWAFIEHFLMSSGEDNMFSSGFSTRKDTFEKQAEKATKIEYMLDENGQRVLDKDGNPIPAGGTSLISMDGWEYTYHIPSEEDVEVVRELMAVAKPASFSNEEIINIIKEEAAPFFKDQKSVDDVVNVIQSRIQIYVSENS